MRFFSISQTPFLLQQTGLNTNWDCEEKGNFFVKVWRKEGLKRNMKSKKGCLKLISYCIKLHRYLPWSFISWVVLCCGLVGCGIIANYCRSYTLITSFFNGSEVGLFMWFNRGVTILIFCHSMIYELWNGACIFSLPWVNHYLM